MRSLRENPPHYVDIQPLPRRRPPPSRPKRYGGYASHEMALRSQQARYRTYLAKLDDDQLPTKTAFAGSQGWSRWTLWRVYRHWGLTFPPIPDEEV
jgi:hypothetical protein